MEQKLKDLTREDLFTTMCEALAASKSKAHVVMINRDAAASRLHVSLTTLWRWDKSGYLPAIHIGRAVWYRKDDVDGLLNGERMVELNEEGM